MASIKEVSQTMMCHEAELRGFDSVSTCINELIAAKTNANRTTRYVTSLQYYLRQFAFGRESRPLGEFTVSDVESWLSNYPSAYTRQTWLNRISTLFSFAVRRGHVHQNICDRIERVTVDKKAPAILTPDRAELLLKTSSVVCRPFVILGLYVGLRPEEIPRLSWDNINLETKTVTAIGKRRRRIVPLEPKAVALLSEHPFKKGPVAPSNSTLDRWRIKARNVLGLDRWPQDLLRHTAASYLIALHKDAGKVATMLGNSTKVLLTHYHEPVTAEASELFWSTKGHTKSYPVGLVLTAAQEQSFTSGKTDSQNKPEGIASHEAPSNGVGEAKGPEFKQSLPLGAAAAITARI